MKRVATWGSAIKDGLLGSFRLFFGLFYQPRKAWREFMGTCPRCGGEKERVKTVAYGIDTSHEVCIECDWTGDPE